MTLLEGHRFPYGSCIISFQRAVTHIYGQSHLHALHFQNKGHRDTELHEREILTIDHTHRECILLQKLSFCKLELVTDESVGLKTTHCKGCCTGCSVFKSCSPSPGASQQPNLCAAAAVAVHVLPANNACICFNPLQLS